MADAEATEPKGGSEKAPAVRNDQLSASGAHAVVIARPPAPAPLLPKVSRRGVVITSFWVGMGALLAGIGATIVNMVWPRAVTGFGSEVFVGTVDQLLPGQKIKNVEAKAWLVRLDEEQARRNGGTAGAILALYQKCPHLGCTVPFRPEYSREDPRNNETYSGWFLCPCHGSTYSDAGVRVFGPAPRSMDTFALTINNGNMTVDTGAITQGTLDNASRGIVPG